MPSLSALLALVRQDLARHGGRLTNPGFVALTTYRFGWWRDGLPPGVARKLLRVVYVALHRRVRNRHRIELHYTTQVGRRVRLSGRGDMVIGNRVVIGDDCSIGHGVTLGKPRDDTVGWPVLGSRVSIGPGAVVVGGIQLGDDVVVGPNAVVMADVPPGARVVARPAVPVVAEEAVRASGWELRAKAARPRYPGPPVIGWLGRRLRRIDIAPGAQVGRGLRLPRGGRVSVADGVRLGDDCVLGYGVTVGWRDVPDTPAPITRLGDRVVLGAGAVVLAGVTVGDDVRIGPNAVVAADVAAGGSVAAPPVGILKRLRPTPA
jgi:serine O-acetyltransferase